MNYQNLILEKKKGVARITLNRPRVLNALNPELITELKAALEEVEQDDRVRVVVLKGAGSAFCAGLDLKYAGERFEAGDLDSLRFIERNRDLLDRMENLPKPIVAAVHGYAVTGGFVLAYFSDIVIASEDAVFQDTHCRWGLVPAWYEAQRMARVFGIFRGKALLMTSDAITAREAQEMGFVYKVVPQGRLEEAVEDLVGKLLQQSPTALRIVKAEITRGMKVDWASAIRISEELRRDIVGGFITPEARERLQAFRERRRPG